MDGILQRARTVLASQPFSVWLGAELLTFAAGQAELRIPIREDLTQQHGFVHGGVVGYVADNALAFAAGSVLGPEVVTSEFKINYVRPTVGDWIVARGEVVHVGKTQAVCRCDVFVLRDDRETLCATAQGTIRVRSRPQGPARGSRRILDRRLGPAVLVGDAGLDP